MAHRIIARLDIKGPNLIKGIHLEGLRVLGKPEFYAKHYYDSGVDELLYMDVVASLYKRNSLHAIIEQTAKQIFIPLTVGGGLRGVADIRGVLRAGADKVSLNTAVIGNPALISEASKIFGSSTIAVTIEAIRQPNNEYLAFTDNGREYTGKEVVSWAKTVEKLGAGEIILTSIDKEGTGAGFDLDLIKQVSSEVSIPVVACGGAGTMNDCAEAIISGGADAVAIASMFHYQAVEEYRKLFKNEIYQKEGNTEFLQSNSTFSKVTPVTIQKLKKYLGKRKIEVRM